MYGPVVVALVGGGKTPMRALLAVRGSTPSRPHCRPDCGPARHRLRFPG